MTAHQLALTGPKHLNRGLFSDYYLDQIMLARLEPLQAAARPVYAALQARLAQINPEALDESQLEDQWIKYAFDQLGLHYSVQVKIRYQASGYRKPDYGLTRTVGEARALTGQIYTPDELREAGVIAVADAKKWGVHLDQAGGPGQRNPSQQIDEYLRYSELPWGILTDGWYWRLYERETSKNNVYYAVDLIDLLERNDLDAFLYFYAFFRQQAFTEGWLTEALKGSSDFAQKLSDTLEDQVYEALELIAQGFLDYRRNRLHPTPDTLRAIYEQSLVLLYRLLFILYAESRAILPMRENTAYEHNLSLDSIKKAIARLNPADLDPDKSDFYGKLKDLFFSIDQGNPRYDLPAYNGRLFSADDHPFLDQQYMIGDKHLASAIDKMARIPMSRASWSLSITAIWKCGIWARSMRSCSNTSLTAPPNRSRRRMASTSRSSRARNRSSSRVRCSCAPAATNARSPGATTRRITLCASSSSARWNPC